MLKEHKLITTWIGTLKYNLAGDHYGKASQTGILEEDHTLDTTRLLYRQLKHPQLKVKEHCFATKPVPALSLVQKAQFYKNETNKSKK